jgi:hypothetical protein
MAGADPQLRPAGGGTQRGGVIAYPPRRSGTCGDYDQKGRPRISLRSSGLRLLQKYRDTPMSLADACVVRMAEIHDRHDVLTLDSDFSFYRKHGRVPLKLIHPRGG